MHFVVESALEYDFNTIVSGHVSKLGGREDVIEGREYLHDLVNISREALETIEIEYFTKQLGSGLHKGNFRGAEENYFNALTNYVTKKMLEKATSNGKRWAERLNGADSMTKHNAFSMVEKTRLERSHNGYVLRGGKKPLKFFA